LREKKRDKKKTNFKRVRGGGRTRSCQYSEVPPEVKKGGHTTVTMRLERKKKKKQKKSVNIVNERSRKGVHERKGSQRGEKLKLKGKKGKK